MDWMTAIDPSLVILWGAAAVLGLTAWRQDPAKFREGLRIAGQLVLFIVTRLPLAIILAGFLAQVIPREAVAGAIGEGTGFGGLMIAAFAGGFIPSGPFVSFPIALTLYKAGASLPAMVAFITGWSVFAFHRVLIWEWPLMGARFSTVRFVASLAVPPLTGVLAGLLYAWF